MAVISGAGRLKSGQFGTWDLTVLATTVAELTRAELSAGSFITYVETGLRYQSDHRVVSR
jgi:hypothetical protein